MDAVDAADDRWRSISMNEVRARSFKIDSLKWLKDLSPDSDDLPAPEELAADAANDLEEALEQFTAILDLLEEAKVERPRAIARRR